MASSVRVKGPAQHTPPAAFSSRPFSAPVLAAPSGRLLGFSGECPLPRGPARRPRPVIFVIFPAYNEERVIRPTLRALADAVRGQEAGYRAVLVDDGSTDHTIAEAEAAVREGGDLA